MRSVLEQGTVYLMPTNEYKEFTVEPSTIESVDMAIYEHINEVFDLHTTTNNGMLKVPVVWLGTERAFQIKNNRSFRDSVGKLVLPLISIERSSMEKDKTFKGPIQAHLEPEKDGVREYRNGAFKVVSVLNQEKTRNFVNAETRRKNKGKIVPRESYKKVYDTYYIPIPTYVKITYSVTLRTEYQQQMNDLIAPFISRTGQINHFVMKKNGHLYEAFIEPSYDQSNNLGSLGEDERKFETKISIKVLGYIIGDGSPNEERPKVIKKENIVEIKIPKESIVLEEDLPWVKKKNNRKKGLLDFE